MPDLLRHPFLLIATLLLTAAPLRAAETEIDPFWFEPVTMKRIETLPEPEQPAWKEYLQRSQQLAAEDRRILNEEVKAAGLDKPVLAPSATVFGVKLNQPVAWFATKEGRRVTAIIISYQTPAGGWSKRLNMGLAPRPRGGDFVSEHTGTFYGTFDNDATSTQLRALARAVAATKDEAATQSFLRGINYIFSAQYPNGGWPQVYPLNGGYHDAITFNDHAMVKILEFLRDVAGGQNEFAWVPEAIRQECAQREQRGRDCVLAAQVKIDGTPTVWGQQHDALTLVPCGARKFEMRSLCSAESAGLVSYLMAANDSSPATQNAIKHAIIWFAQNALDPTKLNDRRMKSRVQDHLAQKKTVWARLYELGTNRPVFGDRDQVVHYDINEISDERHNGYAWYVTEPESVIKRFQQALPKTSTVASKKPR